MLPAGELHKPQLEAHSNLSSSRSQSDMVRDCDPIDPTHRKYSHPAKRKPTNARTPVTCDNIMATCPATQRFTRGLPIVVLRDVSPWFRLSLHFFRCRRKTYDWMCWHVPGNCTADSASTCMRCPLFLALGPSILG